MTGSAVTAERLNRPQGAEPPRLREVTVTDANRTSGPLRRLLPRRLLPVSLLLLAAAGPVAGQGAGTGRGGTEPVQRYAVATLAPPSVVVPPIVLQNANLHALLVELAGGTPLVQIRERLDVSAAEIESLFRLVAVEGLGRQLGGDRWQPLALALNGAGVRRLRGVVAPLAEAIADTLAAHWTGLDSSLAALPVTGRLPLAQTGYVLLGTYLLGLFQYEALWASGLGPTGRAYAFRVYRMDPAEAPPGTVASPLTLPGFRLIRYAPTREPFGFDALLDPRADLHRTLFGQPGGEVAAAGAGAAGTTGRAAAPADEAVELAAALIRAYRLWYLTGREPDLPTRILLRQVEAVDGSGRLRIPIVAEGEIGELRTIALETGAALWPRLMDVLPALGETAAALGYGEDALLGEVTLAAWELAVHAALCRLIERGVILPPVADRGQELLTIRDGTG